MPDHRRTLIRDASDLARRAVDAVPEAFGPDDVAELLSSVEGLDQGDQADAMIAMLSDHLGMGGATLARVLNLGSQDVSVPIRRGRRILERLKRLARGEHIGGRR